MTEGAAAGGALAPLRFPLFRALWLATLVSNVGTWMHDIGAAWLMTSLSPKPLSVALVQSATTLPMFLLALPAGALADIVDRRRLLIFAQLWSLAAAAALAGVAAAGAMTPALLLALTFLLAIGAALSAPAFQAMVPELVPGPSLGDALALNSLGINIARAIGPALGGLIIAAAGPAAVFALNACTTLAVLAAVARGPRSQPQAAGLPAERLIGAMRTGLRYAALSGEVRAGLVRNAAFFLFASALWGLLPLLARRNFGLEAAGYGLLLALMGAGAVLGALARAPLRGRLSLNALSVTASVLFSLAAGALAFAASRGSVTGAAIALPAAGFAWILMLSALNVSAQAAAPAWVRARALSVGLLVFQGAMTAGSALWGSLAGRFGLEPTLAAAAVMLFLAIGLARRYPLGGAEALDLTPSHHWAAPEVAVAPAGGRGPVLVTIEYLIDPGEAQPFVQAMQALRRLYRRDGAMRWELFEDTARPGRFVESFAVVSWTEHLRQHERVTHSDQDAQALVRGFHRGDAPPQVRHFLAVRPE